MVQKAQALEAEAGDIELLALVGAATAAPELLSSAGDIRIYFVL